MNLATWISRQIEFSIQTFGPGEFKISILKHIQSECDECMIAQKPDDLQEWADIITLAFTGAIRAGYSPDEILAALNSKLEQNKARQWPEEMSEYLPLEHVRE